MNLIIRRVLNLLLYLSFCVLAGSGLLMAYKLIPGSRGGRGLGALGWDRHEWGDLHTWVAIAFVALIFAHLLINWRWLVKCAAQNHLWRLAAGLALGAAIIAAFIFLPVKQRERGHGARQHHEQAEN